MVRTFGTPWLRPLLGLLLSASSREALDSPQRKLLFQLVKNNPGITVTHVAEAVPYGWASLYHHLRILTEAGLIKSRGAGRRRLLYAAVPGQTIPRKIAAAPILGATARRIADHIAENPGISLAKLASDLELSDRLAYYHLHNLVQAKLIRTGGRTRYDEITPTPKLKALLAEM